MWRIVCAPCQRPGLSGEGKETAAGEEAGQSARSKRDGAAPSAVVRVRSTEVARIALKRRNKTRRDDHASMIGFASSAPEVRPPHRASLVRAASKSGRELTPA